MVTVSEAQVRQVLAAVRDAHIPSSLESLGMLARVEVTGTHVEIDVSLPCMACPAASHMTNEVRECVLGIEGVEAVTVNLGAHFGWDRSSVDDGARSLMRSHGIQL